jgi:hypothetical protein
MSICPISPRFNGSSGLEILLKKNREAPDPLPVSLSDKHAKKG